MIARATQLWHVAFCTAELPAPLHAPARPPCRRRRPIVLLLRLTFVLQPVTVGANLRPALSQGEARWHALGRLLLVARGFSLLAAPLCFQLSPGWTLALQLAAVGAAMASMPAACSCGYLKLPSAQEHLAWCASQRLGGHWRRCLPTFLLQAASSCTACAATAPPSTVCLPTRYAPATGPAAGWAAAPASLPCRCRQWSCLKGWMRVCCWRTGCRQARAVLAAARCHALLVGCMAWPSTRPLRRPCAGHLAAGAALHAGVALGRAGAPRIRACAAAR